MAPRRRRVRGAASPSGVRGERRARDTVAAISRGLPSRRCRRRRAAATTAHRRGRRSATPRGSASASKMRRTTGAAAVGAEARLLEHRARRRTAAPSAGAKPTKSEVSVLPCDLGGAGLAGDGPARANPANAPCAVPFGSAITPSRPCMIGSRNSGGISVVVQHRAGSIVPSTIGAVPAGVILQRDVRRVERAAVGEGRRRRWPAAAASPCTSPWPIASCTLSPVYQSPSAHASGFSSWQLLLLVRREHEAGLLAGQRDAGLGRRSRSRGARPGWGRRTCSRSIQNWSPSGRSTRRSTR